MSLLDLIFPKRCVGCSKYEGYLCSSCFALISFSDNGFCVVCQKYSIDSLTHPVCRKKYEIDGVFSSLRYKGIVKRLLHQFKYRPHLLDLAETLSDLFYEGIIQKEIFVNSLSKDILFVPVPLHKSRQKNRGYNQSHVLTKSLARKLFSESGSSLGIQKPEEIILDCLNRTVDTRPQFGLSLKERMSNISGAFSFNSAYSSFPQKTQAIFLVDDIVTTGATLREAAKVLKKAGASKVFGIALAHGD